MTRGYCTAHQDVVDAPAHKVAEIVNDRLYVTPRPLPLAALAKVHLNLVLGTPFDRGRNGPGGWWIFHEPEFHLGDDVLVPDVTGWSRERMPTLRTTDYVTLAPDWACEVLSAETREIDLDAKRPVYARVGVSHLWLVDPADHPSMRSVSASGSWGLESMMTRRGGGYRFHVPAPYRRLRGVDPKPGDLNRSHAYDRTCLVLGRS